MEKGIKIEPIIPQVDTLDHPETLSAIVSFRMSPSMLERLDMTVDKLWINRSRLIRATLLTGGLCYVGDEVIRELMDCRRVLANLGNLLKLLANELKPLAENPLLAEETQENLLSRIELVNQAQGEMHGVRERMIEMFKTLHDQLEVLNHGDL